MNPPLVTIVTPSYNQADFLEAAIRSVLEQDYPAIEYFVIDGASTDGSVEIIRRYADRLAGWVSEPDRGQAEAINKGLGRAKGEIVAWLNSDDLYLPGAVRRAVETLTAEPTLGLAYGDAAAIDAAGHPLNRLSFGDWSLADLLRFRIICQPAVFMRRGVFEAAGGLDTRFHMMLDHHLWLRMARLAPIRHVPQLWAAARHHPGAKNAAQSPRFGAETLDVLAWLQTNPDFAPRFAGDARRIIAGAQRLNARYLLDGGLPGLALKAYWESVQRDPAYALKHWRRMAYAAAWLALGREPKQVERRKMAGSGPAAAVAALSDLPGIHTWPGIRMTG
jgi:GT2 family glycosyltransferase